MKKADLLKKLESLDGKVKGDTWYPKFKRWFIVKVRKFISEKDKETEWSLIEWILNIIFR